jgi:hypothetical protein
MKQLLTLLFIGLTSLYAQTVPSYVPTNGLVGWWPFNGNANDESGNGNNGTIYGAVSTTDRNGISNSCYDFDLVGKSWGQRNKEIYIPYSTQFNSSQLTVSVWVYPRSYFDPANSNDKNSRAICRTEGGYSNPNGQVWGIEFNDVRVRGFILSSATTNNQSSAIADYNSPLTLNQWHHIVMTFDGVNVKLFINDILVSSTSTSIAMNTLGTSGLSIGVSNQANGWWYDANAKIDDIGLWNRALTTQEIHSLFIDCNDSLEFQPQNFTAYTNPGWANFTSKHSDTTATYQWQQNSGTGWANVNNFGNYSGATSDSLVITGVTTAMNNYGYRSIVTSCTTDTSDVAVLTVTNGIGLGESKLDKLTVSPNPTNGFVSLNILVLGTYELLTLDGRILESGTAKKEYDLTKYPNGVYNLRNSTDEGNRVLKIVKH